MSNSGLSVLVYVCSEKLYTMHIQNIYLVFEIDKRVTYLYMDNNIRITSKERNVNCRVEETSSSICVNVAESGLYCLPFTKVSGFTNSGNGRTCDQ